MFKKEKETNFTNVTVHINRTKRTEDSLKSTERVYR